MDNHFNYNNPNFWSAVRSGVWGCSFITIVLMILIFVFCSGCMGMLSMPLVALGAI